MAVQDYAGSGNPLGVSISSALAGEDVARDRLKTIESFNFTNITTATTTTVKSGSGHLKRIVINKSVASATITIYNNTTGAAPAIATITLSTGGATDQVPLVADYGVDFSTGLTIVTSGATDITVAYL